MRRTGAGAARGAVTHWRGRLRLSCWNGCICRWRGPRQIIGVSTEALRLLNTETLQSLVNFLFREDLRQLRLRQQWGHWGESGGRARGQRTELGERTGGEHVDSARSLGRAPPPEDSRSRRQIA